MKAPMLNDRDINVCETLLSLLFRMHGQFLALASCLATGLAEAEIVFSLAVQS